VAAQRAETVRLLAPLPGERVLDVGCGPGFLCESISSLVGSDGAVLGVDISSDLIELCKQRGPPKWLSYSVGDATQLAQPDASFDAVVCTQVVEYIPDVSRALTEAFRVLKEDGRAAFVATDWDSVIWFSDFPDRMALVLKSWETHCAHPRLPRSLGARLVSAGFRVDEVVIFPILNLRSANNAYSTGLAGFVQDFVGRKNELTAEELHEW
jgi:arsenite methyltransferase